MKQSLANRFINTIDLMEATGDVKTIKFIHGGLGL